MSRTYSRSVYSRRPVPRRTSCMGALLQGILVILITLVLIAVLLEIGLRFFAPQIVPPLSGLFRPDPVAGYSLRPAVSVHYRSSEADVTFHTNSVGERIVPGYDQSKATNSMVALGDSFTFGMNVQDDQAFPALLNARYNKEGAPQYKVANGGVFGYGTDNEAGWLKEYGWQNNPKVVLVGFFVGNDVKDVMLGITKTVATDDGRLVAAGTSVQAMNRTDEDQGQVTSSSTGVKGWLENNSHAYLFLRNLWYNTLGKGTTKTSKLTVFDAASFFERQVPPEIEAGWQKTFDVLTQIQQDCQAHGAQMVLVGIPAREQVYPSAWNDVKTEFGLKDEDFDLTLPEQRLADFASKHQVAYIDLLPDFKTASASEGNLYFQVDRHWTAKGQALAADAIGRELEKRGIVK
jgi:hypothetical protein